MARRRAIVRLALVSLFLAGQAEAQQVSGGVGGGAILVGSRPRFAASPHVTLFWSSQGGFLLAVHDTCSILPAIDRHGPGIYNQAAAAAGYGWKGGRVSVGPLMSMYSIPVCGPAWCARFSGLSPGAHARLEIYLAGPLGVSVNGNIDWWTERSALHGGVAATVVAGPVLRWGEQ